MHEMVVVYLLSLYIA